MTAQQIYQKISEVEGWFSEEDVQAFLNLDLSEEPTIIECGTYMGRSTRAFNMIWPKAQIYTCDPHSQPGYIGPRVLFYPKRGVEMKKELSDDVVPDMIFIDDSHFYDDIKANFEAFEPILKPGGYIVFHDYWFETDDVAGVRRFVDELQTCDLSNRGKYGLAIWKKP